MYVLNICYSALSAVGLEGGGEKCRNSMLTKYQTYGLVMNM